MTDKKISSFKKFSEMNETKIDNSSSVQPEDYTGIPNLPKKTTKVEKEQSTRYMKPRAQTPDSDDYSVPEEEDTDKMEDNGQLKYEDEVKEGKVQFIGKVAKLPKGVQASKGLNFMENVKIPKSSIWYLMIEKQNNELQMIKYNLTKGFDLGRFSNDLKGYYEKKFAKNPKLVEKIKSIEIDGDDKYSWIKNIPLITVDGKKLISIITEDLIRLLSK
jgi:hypothetical protein